MWCKILWFICRRVSQCLIRNRLLQIPKFEGIFPVGKNKPVFGKWRGNSPPSPSRENLVTFFPSSFISLVFLNEFHFIQGCSVATCCEVTRKKKNFKTCLLKVLQIISQKECIRFVSLCNSKMNGKKHNVRRSLLINNAWV